LSTTAVAVVLDYSRGSTHLHNTGYGASDRMLRAALAAIRTRFDIGQYG
jgi:hypothetical protein